jgi:magnesium transporter
VIVDCAAYRDGERITPELPEDTPVRALPGLLDQCQADPSVFVWVGLHEPTDDELSRVAAEFDLHPLAVEDAAHAHQRPKLERYGEQVFVVLRTANYVDSEEIVDLGELMAFIGGRFLVTVRYGPHTSLGGLRRSLESDAARLSAGPGAVVHAIVDMVVDEYEAVLDELDGDIDEIEAEVFSGERIDRSKRIFKLKREVGDFRRGVTPLIEPLSALASGRVDGVNPELAPWFRDVHDHHLRVADRLEAIDSLLSDALQANVSQVAVRQNEDMRRISAWVALAAVPTMVAGIYGMNFENMPELEWKYGYPMVLVGLAIACSALYRMFKRRGWL